MTKKILRNMIEKVNSIIKLDKRNTGPTIYERNQHLAISYNIYNNLEANWFNLNEIIRNIFEINKSLPKGEIIIHNGNGGKIIDTGEIYFEIVKSKIWECYFYEKEDFLYLRVLWEKDLKITNKKIDNNKEWISLDIDLVFQSAWFSENKRKSL
ncbi:MAG: hypothetical protein HeimC3_10450 [Candidatus Heimdallarchaeota archaeon LC_3]|nr:MAG: hypothetical protein HeimC3_10450 [Candidatus Heimdallarchaeota archaeon LC_3]